MAPYCADDVKYQIVEQLVETFSLLQKQNEKILGQNIAPLVTVNGVRFTLEDGSWGLIRASSNKPSLVIVVESPVSESRMHDVFEYIDGILKTIPAIGAYDQKISR